MKLTESTFFHASGQITRHFTRGEQEHRLPFFERLPCTAGALNDPVIADDVHVVERAFRRHIWGYRGAHYSAYVEAGHVAAIAVAVCMLRDLIDWLESGGIQR